MLPANDVQYQLKRWPLAQREATHNNDGKSQEIEDVEIDSALAGTEVVNTMKSVPRLSPGGEVSMKH